MLKNKKIVVVMPAYNAEKTLRKTYDDIPHEFVDQVIRDGRRRNAVSVSRGFRPISAAKPQFSVRFLAKHHRERALARARSVTNERGDPVLGSPLFIRAAACRVCSTRVCRTSQTCRNARRRDVD